MSDARLWREPGAEKPTWHDRPDHLVFLSEAVQDEALRLVEESRELVIAGRFDDSAARLLARKATIAGLVKAAEAIDFQGSLEEVRIENLAYRLLTAAANGESVRHPSAAEAQYLADIEALDLLMPDGAFEFLAQREQRLHELRASVARDVEDARAASRAVDESEFDEVVHALEAIVGPWSSSEDALLSSLTALGMCRLHLRRLVGLPIDDDH